MGDFILSHPDFFFFFFLMIARRTITCISRSTGFAISPPYESVLGTDDRSGPLFPISQGTLPWQLILWKNSKLPSFVALAFRNGMGYCYVNVHINSVNDTIIVVYKFRELWSSNSKDDRVIFGTFDTTRQNWRIQPNISGYT